MRVKEFLENAADITKGYLIASLTDQYIVDYWPMKKYTLADKTDKILDIRIFCESEERKLFRADISREFTERSLSDENENGEYFDECQLVDIDETKTYETDNGYEVTTTGGGNFFLPVADRKGDVYLRFRYYSGMYDMTGQSKVEKWRLVGFEEITNG